jgi:hypothetical protein
MKRRTEISIHLLVILIPVTWIGGNIYVALQKKNEGVRLLRESAEVHQLVETSIREQQGPEFRMPTAQEWTEALAQAGVSHPWALNAAVAGRSFDDPAFVDVSRTVLAFETADPSHTLGGRSLLAPKPSNGTNQYMIAFVDGGAVAIDPDEIDNLIWTLPDSTPAEP